MGAEKKNPKKKGWAKRPIDGPEPAKKDISVEATHFPPHKHCLNCGLSIPPGKETCSGACKEQWEKMLKRKKYWTYLPIIGFVLLMLFYLLIML